MAAIGIASGFLFQVHLYCINLGLRTCETYIVSLFMFPSLPPRTHHQLVVLRGFWGLGLMVLAVVHLEYHQDHTTVVIRKGDDVRSIPESCLWLHSWRTSMCAIARLPAEWSGVDQVV